MNISLEKNLDYLAAKHAQELIGATSADAKEIEKTITTSLGVLQENGVYACFLYLLASQKKKEKGEDESREQKIIQQMRALLEALELKIENTPSADLEYAQEITKNLPTLLLAKEALEQMLIYARYGAKARQKE